MSPMSESEFQLMMAFVANSRYTPQGQSFGVLNALVSKGWVEWSYIGMRYDLTTLGRAAYHAKRETLSKEEMHALWRKMMSERNDITPSVPAIVVEPRAFRQDISIRPATKSFRDNIRIMHYNETDDEMEDDEALLAMAARWQAYRHVHSKQQTTTTTTTVPTTRQQKEEDDDDVRVWW